MSNFIVITTINPKTKAIFEFEKILPNWHLVLIGDKKSKEIEQKEGLTFLSVENQEEEKFNICSELPFNHYARKNIGYLYSLKKGASIIYDSDDDNLPNKDWSFPPFSGKQTKLSSEHTFFNIYSAYSSDKIWPRGFPLRKINQSEATTEHIQDIKVGVWQGLVDLDPDVDAIFRLINPTNTFFEKNKPLVLENGLYCPFNSQNTLWAKEMIPYAYLPSTVSFRFTDILRGYIAQRAFWEHNRLLGFTQANAYQERNEHDLMKDFESEIPCYTQVEQVVEILNSLNLSSNYEQNLITIYSALLSAKIVKSNELKILEKWLMDLHHHLKY